ncbi:MAG: hypothetical protein HON90_11480 [Halobacteriovoraceae bacterium]|jgi:dihydrofolate synthase / folylpolyglutamate synthase|nr:hypothetical protein [Halobacteriovoraceae bacterium]
MTPDLWLSQYYEGEFFSGQFEHLKKFIHQLSLNKIAKSVIIVAGTNGKGETSRCIAQIAGQHNISYGLWTSPHLVQVNERFVFCGEMVSDFELVECFCQLEDILIRESVQLSYFEFLFVTFLILAKKRNLDTLILEVGLGGKLDAVNTLDGDYFVLTSLSRDHQELLGNTYKSILYEKLGVLRKKKLLYTALELRYVKQMVSNECEKQEVKWIDLFEQKILSTHNSFSQRNRTLAMRLMSDITGKNIAIQTSEVNSCRRALLKSRGVLFELFSSHNIDGLRKLVHFLKDAKYNYDYILISFSERSIIDLRVMTKILLNEYNKTPMLFYRFDHYKALKSSTLEEITNDFGLEITDDKKFLQNFSFKDGSKVLVTGSNYFLGHFMQTSKFTRL